MVKLPAFEVEQWMDKYENTPGVLNIAETCCSSISIDQLVQFNSSQQEDTRQLIDFSKPMTYGPILGSDELRRNITAIYNEDESKANTQSPPLTIENIIITQGAIAANHLVFYSLVGPGDHVISVFPTYQQLYTIPESLGAEVSLWKLKVENGYVPDVAELEGLIKSNTKMIVVNNPNNPTGVTIPEKVLSEIISISRKHDIILFSDEVYRPLFHSIEQDRIPPSAISMGYPKVVATSSMSKAWALAGIRIGWVASRDSSIISAIASARDYTTISVSQLDDQVARYALSASVRPQLIARNISLAENNLKLLEQFVADHSSTCSWTKPSAGTTALVRFNDRDGMPVDDEQFCKDVLEKTKVMFLPGSRCFGHGQTSSFDGTVRIGYVSETEVLRQALEKLGIYITDHLL
ncbi:PLP-dependent transferase [Annulohypoxylon truncatum]|uniref:PLP-dependent transferase n=1 Tax=Annulohypoxylon truncatum TaxID=327061 RepID=UPI002007486C|nr:PLP-dependent transferase [Annulohypoxylon truncatum]KAI1207006.1 PLP-dependent transferase [Annulohypoxylon truncatum]